MSLAHWPRLSIRATVLAAIVVGVVLPALVVLALDGVFTRKSLEPSVQRNRAAVVALATAAITEPAWTLSEPGLHAAVERILSEPSVCSVEVLDLQPTVGPLVRRRAPCHDAAAAVRDAAVLYEGQQIARLRVGFDDSEVDRALAERRGVAFWLVAAQVLFGVSVLAGVLSLRLLRPIDELKRQAGRIAAREAQPAQPWPRRDELGQLGQHLNAVHAQIAGLIGELEAKNAALRRLAMHDPLTGLPNRTLLRELFEHEAAKARREGDSLALVFVDLDGFKAVNDTHGHAAGDALLVGIAQALRDAVRESDVVCRLGGDEFLVLLQPQTRDQAAATAERLLQAIDVPRPLAGDGALLRVRASLGIAMYPDDADDFDQLVRAADQAMYRSKQAGRARWAFWRGDREPAAAGHAA